MPSFLEKAAESDQQIRSTQEKDPADLSGAKEPDWENPDTWGGGSPSGDSASEKAGDSASRKEPEPTPEAKPSKTARPSTATRTPALRRGRPKGPARRPLSVRILEANDRMLTAAVESTGQLPQTIVDDALAAHFRRLKIQDPGPQPNPEGTE